MLHPPSILTGSCKFEPGVTLQINISPGDLRYLDKTVPKIVESHRSACRSTLFVLDCCRPQASRLVDPEAKFPESSFFERVNATKAKVQLLSKELGIDQCVCLEKPRDTAYFRYLASKYVGRGLIDSRTSHSGGGTAFMSYWAAFELPITEHVLHFDADMLVHQSAGYSWVEDALARMGKSDRFISAIPRNAPPQRTVNQPTEAMGRPLETINGEWANDWFSTRLFLLNRRKLMECLPLVSMTPSPCIQFFGEMWLRKLGRSVFPRDPEIILFKKLTAMGLRTLILQSEQAWSLHPVAKGDWFVSRLEEVISAVGEGDVPDGQRGREDLREEAWQKFLK